MSGKKFSNLPLSTSGPQDCTFIGSDLLRNAFLNKGSAFSRDERDEFELNGLLPKRIHTLEEQVARAYDQYNTHRTPLGKNTFMASMKIQNEVL